MNINSMSITISNIYMYMYMVYFKMFTCHSLHIKMSCHLCNFDKNKILFFHPFTVKMCTLNKLTWSRFALKVEDTTVS